MAQKPERERGPRDDRKNMPRTNGPRLKQADDLGPKPYRCPTKANSEFN